MKKIFNIALSAMMAFAFAACEDDPYLGQPVVNPQQPIMPADGITATDIVAPDGSVNLEAAKSTGSVDMLSITRLENFPADQQLRVVMNVSATEDMASSLPVDLPLTEAAAPAIYTAAAPAEDFDNAFKQLVSREPSVKAMYVNYVAYVLQGTTSVLLGAVGTPQKVMVTPFGYEHPLEDNYYIYGTATDNAIATALKLNHEGSPYDSPVYKVKVDITSDQINADGGWKFKVIPQSTKDAGKTWEQDKNLTFIGFGGKEGTMAYATAEEDCEWIVISKPGSYMLNVNVLDLTYELTNAIDYLYVPGSNNDWSSWSTKLFTSDYINYTGFANLVGDFKFTGTAGWNVDFGNYGSDPNAGDKANYTLLNGSNDNFKLDGTPGLYKLNVSLGTLTYDKQRIEKIGVVGSHNGWNAGEAPLLTPSDDNLSWEGTITFSAGDEFKFCMNGGWDINLGGAEDNLTFGAANLKAPEAGTFLILLDLSTVPYQCYLEKQ